MNIIIIEDEPLNVVRLETLLKELEPTIQVLQVLDSVETAVPYLQSSKDVDLIFLDIQLTDGLGFDILLQLKQSIPVIITLLLISMPLKHINT